MNTLWLRWSWRDLRRRWLLVATIALVIGLGTGTYAALLSTSEWRRQSNDASFALLDTHDLRVRLGEGGTVGEGRLTALVAGIPHAAAVQATRERLVVPTQVATGPVLASGQLVGSATAGPGGSVDGVRRSAGRELGAADDGEPVVVLDRSFAEANGLPDTGRLTLSGNTPATYVGLGQSPEHFLVSADEGALPFMSQRSYAVMFGSLPTVQRLAGAPGQVNDVVVRLRDPAALEQVRQELRQAVAGLRPQVSAEVTTKAELDSYRVLYDDIAGDEKLWRVIAILVLLGAAFAALNLTTRVVEAQRREIGIGMALGVPGRTLSVRPLLFGAQVALIGVLLGLAVGRLLGIPLRALFMEVAPLPVWLTPFQPGVFAQAAVLGFALPFAGVVWPVARAIRVQPVQAIRVGHLAARRTGGTRLLRHLPLPGRSYRQVPVRNLLRTPRRSLLTALGIAAAITTLVTTVGFLDTFNATLDDAEGELLHAAPDRVSVSLQDVQPVDGDVVRTVRAIPEVARAGTGLMLAAEVSGGASGTPPVDLVVETLGSGSPWTPTLTAGSAAGGLVLAEKAARDLHVGVGDAVTLTHPRATAGGGLEMVQSRLLVAGLHPNPVRLLAYLGQEEADVFGMAGVTNLLTVTPREGATTEDVRRALLAVPGVGSAEASEATMDAMRSSLDEFLGVLQVAGAVTLLLALLIAFNTASIGMDERTREHATMLAFGLPVRTVLAMTTVETVLLGAAGTMLGIAGGYGVLAWMTATTIPTVMPELGVTATLAAGTVGLALLLGVATVAAAPLLTLRRLRRTDVPATLRVVE